MDFYALIMLGYTVSIEDITYKGDPAVFYSKNNQLYAWCPAMGEFGRGKEYSEKFNEHLNNMFTENCKVTFYPAAVHYQKVIDKIREKWLFADNCKRMTY